MARTPRPKRARKPKQQFEAGPARHDKGGDYVSSPEPSSKKRAAKSPKAGRGEEKSASSRRAVVAVHSPDDDPDPFWLARVDKAAPEGVEGATLGVTWIEPTGDDGAYALGAKDALGIAPDSVICTVRAPGEWEQPHKGFILSDGERAAIEAAIAAEQQERELLAQADAECRRVVEAAASQTLVHLDGLPGSGKSYMCSQLAESHGYSVIELDEITQRPGSRFGFTCAIEGKEQLEAAFHRELAKLLAATQERGAQMVLLCGVSKIVSEWGEVSVLPSGLTTTKLWIDIAPPSELKFSGELQLSAERLSALGVPAHHIAEIVESARRSVLRDLRDTQPEAWAETAEDWGEDSRFYSHMADHHPEQVLSAADYERLAFAAEPAVIFGSDVVPELAEWTALTLDDMTGRGREQGEGEEYHLARGKAEGAGYAAQGYDDCMQAVHTLCAADDSTEEPAEPAEPAEPTEEEEEEEEEELDVAPQPEDEAETKKNLSVFSFRTSSEENEEEEEEAKEDDRPEEDVQEDLKEEAADETTSTEEEDEQEEEEEQEEGKEQVEELGAMLGAMILSKDSTAASTTPPASPEKSPAQPGIEASPFITGRTPARLKRYSASPLAELDPNAAQEDDVERLVSSCAGLLAEGGDSATSGLEDFCKKMADLYKGSPASSPKEEVPSNLSAFRTSSEENEAAMAKTTSGPSVRDMIARFGG